jgi:ATP-dependent exoDNAse (exonuclease V) alpha subunit
VLFLGDPYQLPPVESRSVLDFFASYPEIIFSLETEQNFRFQNPALPKMAQALKKQLWPDFLQNLTEVVWLEEDGFLENQKKLVKKAADTYRALFEELKEPEAIMARLNDFRLLSALRVGPLGTETLNAEIKKLLGRDLPLPIVIARNDYRQKLFNGEMGFIFRGAAYFADEAGRVRRISPYLLDAYDLGFALSVHKSQGSEYHEVGLILPEGSEKFEWKLLYTAITRAKNKLWLWTSRTTLKRFFKV